MAISEPKLEAPTICKAYVWGLCKRISPENMARNMVLTYMPSFLECWDSHWYQYFSFSFWKTHIAMQNHNPNIYIYIYTFVFVFISIYLSHLSIILFYSVLFYSLLFCSVLFYSLLFYSILFFSFPFYSILLILSI